MLGILHFQYVNEMLHLCSSIKLLVVVKLLAEISKPICAVLELRSHVNLPHLVKLAPVFPCWGRQRLYALPQWFPNMFLDFACLLCLTPVSDFGVSTGELCLIKEC